MTEIEEMRAELEEAHRMRDALAGLLQEFAGELDAEFGTRDFTKRALDLIGDNQVAATQPGELPSAAD